MPNLHDIDRRIKSVTSTKQITRTMEMVAAAKVRRATERVVEATPYAQSMAEMLANVADTATSSNNALLTKHDAVKNVAVIVVVSDRGLAGGFNSNLLREAEKFIHARKTEGVKTHVVACGKKAIGFFNYRNIPLDMVFTDLSADPTVEEAAAIAQKMISGYTDNTFDQVVLFYNHAKNAMSQEVTQTQILPIDERALMKDEHADAVKGTGLEEDEAKDVHVKGDVAYEPSAEEVLSGLLPAYVRTQIYHGLIDSAAGEQAARRNAMKSATDNANDMVNTLQRYYNRVRQGAITTEISEIVGGAAALED